LRFLANENIPLLVVKSLAAEGFDIVSATTVCQGAPDWKVLDLATREGRIVLTFDKDYGYLVFREKRPSPAGVLLLRFPPRSVEYIHERLARILSGNLPLTGHFTVASERRIRTIPLRPSISPR
jgi:predicted nuclease of predicted toxin-antitoxin system